MARMVFGQMVEGIAPAKAEHFAASKLVGTQTACGVTIKPGRQVLRMWKEWKMVTCKRCLACQSN